MTSLATPAWWMSGLPPSLLESTQALAAVLSLGVVPAHPLTGMFDVRSGRRAGAAWKQALPA